MLAHSPVQPTLQQLQAPSGATVGPVDWQNNALYASNSPAPLSDESPASIKAAPLTPQGPEEDLLPAVEVEQAPIGPAHADSAADAPVGRVSCRTPAQMQSTVEQHTADAEAAEAVASISPASVAAKQAAAHALDATALEKPSAFSQAGTVDQQPEQTASTVLFPQSEGTGITPASLSQPDSALPAVLPGLSLTEAKQLLHLISSLQAAGALVHPSAAIAKAAAWEQLAQSKALPAGDCMQTGMADRLQDAVHEQQQQVQTCIAAV